jgi:hypothetical protein
MMNSTTLGGLPSSVRTSYPDSDPDTSSLPSEAVRPNSRDRDRSLYRWALGPEPDPAQTESKPALRIHPPAAVRNAAAARIDRQRRQGGAG